MELERRRLFKLTLGLGVALATPLWWLTRKVLPARYVEAVRATTYPGPCKDLDEKQMKRPGRWGG